MLSPRLLFPRGTSAWRRAPRRAHPAPSAGSLRPKCSSGCRSCTGAGSPRGERIRRRLYASCLEPHELQSLFCRRLLGYLLASARAVADDIAVEMNFDAEGLVVVGSALADEDIFDRLFGIALDYLLQGGLVVRDDRLLLVRLIDKRKTNFFAGSMPPSR